MQDAIRELELKQSRICGELKLHSNQIESNKTSITKLEKNMGTQFEQVWDAIGEMRRNINSMLWKIFLMVTVPLIILILTNLFRDTI